MITKIVVALILSLNLYYLIEYNEQFLKLLILKKLSKWTVYTANYWKLAFTQHKTIREFKKHD